MIEWLSLHGRRLLAALVFALVAASGGCSANESAASFDEAGPAIDPGVPDDSDGGPDVDASDSDDGAPAPTGFFRVAHLAADVGAVDVCYRTSPSAAFIGPLVTREEPDAGTRADTGGDAGDAAVDAKSPDSGASAGLTFPAVSAYLPAPVADGLEIAIVGAADRSCAAPRARGHVTIGVGTRLTVAFVGVSSADAGAINELGIVAFPDDPSVDPSKARTRFVNGALGTYKLPPSDALAVSVSTPNGEITLAPRVELRQTTTPSDAPTPVDALGYSTAPLVPYGSLICRHLGGSGGSWASASLVLGMAGGSVHTGFVVSAPSASALAIVWCDDIGSTCELAY